FDKMDTIRPASARSSIKLCHSTSVPADGLPERKRKRIPAANPLLSMLQNFGLEIDRFGTSTDTRVHKLQNVRGISLHFGIAIGL
ncbi:MAG: hypothetical protein ACI9HK_005676, partial [Pirellulaceae bacterium]